MCAYDEVDSEIENIVHICIKFKNLIYGLGVNHLSGINLHKAMKAMDVQHSTEMITSWSLSTAAHFDMRWTFKRGQTNYQDKKQ